MLLCNGVTRSAELQGYGLGASSKAISTSTSASTSDSCSAPASCSNSAFKQDFTKTEKSYPVNLITKSKGSMN